MALAVGLTLFDRGTLVVRLFALGQGNFQLNPALFPVQRQWRQGIALAFHGTDELADFIVVQ